MAKSAKRLAKLYCVGASYELADLQAFITKQLHETKLWERLPGMEFFELAEKLYPDDPDEAENDSFAKFFAAVGSLFLPPCFPSFLFSVLVMVQIDWERKKQIFTNICGGI